jgi:PAS domain S-box-containing protein
MSAKATGSAVLRFVRNEYAWVAAAFVVLIAVAYVVSQAVTTDNFDPLERQNVIGQADRISTSLGYEASLISNFVVNNSEWDDADSAIVRRNPTAAAVAFPPQQMRTGFGFGAVVLLDRAGTVVGGGMVGSGPDYRTVSRSLAAGLARPAVAAAKANCGVLAAAEAHYLYCASPVVHSDGSGPEVGRLVVLRTLDAAGMAAIGRRAGLSIRLADMALKGATTSLPSRLGALKVQTRTVSGERTDLLVAVPAVEGSPPLVLKLTFATQAHAAAIRSADTSAEIIGLLGIALLGISILAQRVGRERRYRAFLYAVRAATASGERVTPPARELAMVATGVNELLDTITVRQLEAQQAIAAMAAATTAELESEARARQAAAYAAGQEEIADLGRLALKGASLTELFDRAVGAASRVLSSDCVWLVKCSPDGSDPVLLAEVGWPDELRGQQIAGEGRSLSGYAVGSRGSVAVQDWEQEERFSRSSRRSTHKVRSSLGVLVGDRDSPFGVLEVQYVKANSVPADSAPFLTGLANVLSEAIDSRTAQKLIREQSSSLGAMTESLRGMVMEKERLIEQIPGVVVVLDFYADGSRKFVFVSRKSATLLGAEPSTFHENSLWFIEHVHPEDRERLRVAMLEPAVSGLDPPAAEFRFLHPDGQQVWLRVESALVCADAESQRIQVVLFDITSSKQAELERERLELDLRLAQKLEAVGQLAAGVAHEINTPVQFIGNSVVFLNRAADKLLTLTNVYHELLHSDEPIDKEERQRRADVAEEHADLEYLTERVPPAFERALDGIERVSSIVHAMRQFAHPSTERAPTDINAGIRATLIVTKNEYKYVADIVLDLGELPLVPANASDLNQVFLSLIVNASHAIESEVRDTDQRGTITLRTRVDDGGVLITVTDTGGGIPADIAGRVFDQFFTTKPVGRGTGQGLAIAHRIIVERHHGAINFEPNPGGGTTFRVRLPLEVSAEGLLSIPDPPYDQGHRDVAHQQ